MPRLVTGLRRPMTERTYVPNAAGGAGFRAQDFLVSGVRTVERGPDVDVRVEVRGIIQPHAIELPRADEGVFVARLFREPEPTDRAAIRRVLQDLEDAAAVCDIAGLQAAWKQAMAMYETMAADLAALAGLPQNLG